MSATWHDIEQGAHSLLSCINLMHVRRTEWFARSLLSAPCCAVLSCSACHNTQTFVLEFIRENTEDVVASAGFLNLTRNRLNV